jgi:cellulose synthase (UDP-forming)
MLMLKVRYEIAFTWASLVVVLGSFGLYLQTAQGAEAGWHSLETFVFVVVVALLISGNVVYHVSRLGYLYRRRTHRAASRDILEAIYDSPAPAVSILVPSYKEEARVLLQTVLSVALMEYPHRRVVVLLDDPPSSTVDDLVALHEARRLVRELHEYFAKREQLIAREQVSFMKRLQSGQLDLPAENLRVARLYEQVATWLDEWADRINASPATTSAHTDRLFIEKILRCPASEHRIRATQLRSALSDSSRLAHEYRRLAGLMSVDITSFERKRYANLSHQPNKAMNLNSYIGLIGHCYREIACSDGLHLVECEPDHATLIVPRADYLLTVDADSIVLPDYALRLVHIMEQDTGIAVAQTPYSAFPNAPGLLERIAGATTDIQYLTHQGSTWFDATYWVGANALLRLRALHDICEFVEERGYRLPVFIQDRTVIEDTGSTIDLIKRGWRLYNYPDRLAYSAYPAGLRFADYSTAALVERWTYYPARLG